MCDIDESSSTLIRHQVDQVVQLQPGQIITKVSVPYQVVGLVVGPRGTTIKRIQQNTNTYIVTPSRDSQPVFAIQGLPENVAQAKVEIENYIQLRTNNNTTPTPPGYCSSLSSSSNSSTSDPAYQYAFNMFNQNTNSNEYEFFNNGLDIIDELKKKSDNNPFLQESSIWSSPISTFSTQSDDCLVNSIQQNLNPTLNCINGIRSSLSSASSTSSSASSSFSLAKADNTFQFFNSQSDSLSGLISGIDSMNIFNCLNNDISNSYSASSSLSSSSSSHDHHTNSIFQQHENLFNQGRNGLISQETLSNDFNQLYSSNGSSGLLSNFQQQPQYF